MEATKRKGVLAGGNFIIDYVKLIDAWPAEDMLASIRSESRSNGGGPYNVLKDLAAMGAGFPLEAVGLVGSDANGDWILEDCRAHGIDTAQLYQTAHAPTSYTDAMTVESTGRRTFFHQRGANALLAPGDFGFGSSQARLFHLAYLMLLDSLDVIEGDGLTGAARVLAEASQAGMITSADIVSADHPQFREIAEPALPHLDHLCINEIEAGKITGNNLRPSGSIDLFAVGNAARTLLAGGVRREVVIHFEEGALALDSEDHCHSQGSLNLPQEEIVGATGAGDAFAAGYLHGVHESLSTPERLRQAVCAAAVCLSDPTPSSGLVPLPECLALAERFGFRDL